MASNSAAKMMGPAGWTFNSNGSVSNSSHSTKEKRAERRNKRRASSDNQDSQEPSPSRERLQDGFGEDFHKKVWSEIIRKFAGKEISPADVEDFVEGFPYEFLKDEGNKYILEKVFTNVVVTNPDATEVLHDNPTDWSNGTFIMPYGKEGTAFNPTKGTIDGPIISFEDKARNIYLIGILLRVKKPVP